MLFNNCHGRPHEELYGAGAFYDLGLEGPLATQATDLEAGQHCVVASRTESGDIEFNWYSFLQELQVEMPDVHGTIVRVFFGEWLGYETLTQATAAQTEPYSARLGD